MIRWASLVLAVGLVILWIMGLNFHATPWLTWLDALGALFAFSIAAGLGAGVGSARAYGTAAPVALGIGLGVLWIIGLATNAQAWLAWWTLGFACAFLLLGILGGTAGERAITPPTHLRPV